MDDGHDHDEPGLDEGAEVPDPAALLGGVVRCAALRLPPDRGLPLVYVIDPSSEQPRR